MPADLVESGAPGMSFYTIWVDGRPYCGESDVTEEAPAASGAFWLQSPVTTRNTLIFGTGEPYRVEGRRNLASHLERILSRHRDGTLPFREITIRNEGTG